ncbi:MAG TPA: GGDEF domain-containing protein [Pirellulales bacterium]|nr:GGDEF domain-containing protein [Pirellulales bacterium]
MNMPLDSSTLQSTVTSTFIWIGLAMALVELLIGMGVGWWLRGGRSGGFKLQPESGKSQQHQDDLHEAEHALSNLQELAQRVKADVGAHSSQVEAISNQLNAGQARGGIHEAKVLEAVTKILSANQQLEERLHTAESKLQQQAEQIKVHATNALTDALTTLGNRRAFDAELPRRIADYQRRGETFSLLMLDVDHFKKFNDVHGHLAGDEVLRMVGRTLKVTARKADFVARYGGEEFAIVMPCTPLAEAVECAQRVREGVEQAMCEFEGKKLNVTASIGVAEITAGQTPSALVQCADEALYAAKQGGRNQVQRYRSSTTPPPASPAHSVAESAAEKSAAAKPALLFSATPASGDARTDAQTGLPNRTAFCEEIHRRLSEAQRHGNRLSLMLITIDKFDELVQKHGAHAGNLVLRTCTQFLTAAMREMDVVARYRSDVFGILLPGTALSHASAAGERLRVAVEHCPLRLMDKDIRFTISGGTAEAQPGEDLVTFITRTEDSKAAAAQGSGNKIRLHNGLAVEALSEQALAAVS